MTRLSIAVAALAFTIGSTAWAAPKKPAKGKIKVTVNLYGEKGYTEVDADGITYFDLGGHQIGHENKNYKSSLWDQYKLYFFGAPVGVKVSVTNKTKKDYTFQLDWQAWNITEKGKNDKPLHADKAPVEIAVPAGKTVTKDVSFNATQQYGAGTGLDRGTATLLWDGTVIKQSSVLFCPPELYQHLLRFYDFLNFLP
jgi:hypothetical protein